MFRTKVQRKDIKARHKWIVTSYLRLYGRGMDARTWGVYGERIIVGSGNEGQGLILNPASQAGQKLGWDPGRSLEMVIASHG